MKKRKDNMQNLEHEFEEFKNSHKYNIVAACLIICDNEGIYHCAPALEKYADIEGDSEEKAFMAADELFAVYESGDTKVFNKIYEMCWKKIRNRISDKKSYNLE